MLKWKSMTTIAKEEVAEKMIADGLSEELIAKYTDLSRREINAVKKCFLKNREREKNNAYVFRTTY